MNLQSVYKILFFSLTALFISLALINLKTAIIIFIIFHILYAIMRTNGFLPK